MAKKMSASEQAKTFLEMNQEDKLQCLNTIRGFVTLNSISKDTLKVMFDWLFDETVTVEKAEVK
ncbi:hypothetical protein [Carnobacterium pleistocenium]|uniref:hypothetical protein n=1 Tax=Carnobacterium pleistocenium TaxID=181073 RepID=UPI0005527CFB|nr:hypothetical protein [Carnobacterium pleistocenium]